LLNVFSIDSFTPSQGEKHINSILYNPLDLSGAADDPTNSDTLESFAKTGTDFASGLGIGKVLSVDESPSAGLTIGATLLSMGIGHAFDRFITKPYITKPTEPDLIYRNPIDDLTILLNAYHGYKRNDGSLVSAFGWGISSYIAGPELTGIALAQGFGKNIK